MRMPVTSARVLLYCIYCTLVTSLLSSAASFAQDPSEALFLIRQLGQYPAATDPRIQGNGGQPMSIEQKREALYVKLRALDRVAVSALQHGLMDTDVQIRRNVALYLGEEGGNYAKHAPAPLDLRPLLRNWSRRCETRTNACTFTGVQSRYRDSTQLPPCWEGLATSNTARIEVIEANRYRGAG